ncbi:MAG TPA: hypothetical protein VJI75_03165 [Candidatus Nanoarchaeia archaeon]|nr:hypothetical protein [Candidatus Nanoarchaeia archaeon]
MKRVLAITVILLFLAACSSGTSNDSSAQPKSSDDSAVPTPAAQKTIPSSGVSKEQSWLMNALSNKARYRIEYKDSYSGGQMPDSTSSMYIMGTSLRMDVNSIGDQDYKMRIYKINDKLTQCSTGVDNTWRCFGYDQPITAPDPEKTKTQYANVKLPYIGERTYAGQLSKCFTYGGGEFCHNSAGALMYMKISGTEKIATDYSASVSDADFVLPATEQDISEFGK